MDYIAIINNIFFGLLNFAGPFIVLLILWFIFKKVYHHYKTQKFISGIKWALLEIRVPRDVNKSPKAMEFILSNALYQVTGKGFWEEWILGTSQLWYSCEIASIGGQVHFYIRTPTRTRNLIESQIYAQYPQAEIIEVEDYTYKVGDIEKGGAWNGWGCDFTLANGDFLPIKTYVDWETEELDEEEGLDPITAIVEYLGSIKPQEQIWIQFIIKGSKKTYHTPGTIFGEHDLMTEYQRRLEAMVEPYRGYKLDPIQNTLKSEIRMNPLIEAKTKPMQKKFTKLLFDVGIRCMYVAPSNAFNVDTYKGLRMMFRQYNNPDVNSLQRINSTQIDNPWEMNFAGTTITKMKNHHLHSYRARTYFYPGLREGIHWWWPLSAFVPNHPPHPCILNTEEIASLFHFPGRISKTPSFRRIDSRKAEPPSNLPS